MTMEFGVWEQLVYELMDDDIELIAISDGTVFEYVYQKHTTFSAIKRHASIENCPITEKAMRENRTISEERIMDVKHELFQYRVSPLVGKHVGSLTIIRKRKQKARVITVKTGDKWLPIPYENVVYLEAHDRKTHVVSNEGIRGIHRLNLKDLEKELHSGSFIRCHRSYIINIGQVKEIHPDSHATFEFIMKNNDRIPISQNYARHIRRLFGF